MSLTESTSLHINDKDRDKFFTSISRNTLRIFSSFCLLLISILPFIFDIIIGTNYREAYNYIPIFIIASMANCMVSVYSAIYVAKKLTKKVAITSALAAFINIVVDLALINFIGLYAAAISTAIAYISMAIYRHFDLKKYVKITYKLSEIIYMIFAFIIVCALYFMNNSIFNILAITFAILYSVFQNRNIINGLITKFIKRGKI